VPARGIGDTTIEKLEHAAAQAGISLYQAVANPSADDITPSARKKIQAFTDMMERLHAVLGDLTVTDLVRRAIDETRYVEVLEKNKSVEARIRIENLKELITATEDFQEQNTNASLATFLDQVALITDLEQQSAGERADGHAESVTLMTLHNAKGLEFAVVFMAGMEEGLFPHARSAESEADLEEECRLCYVGITRAKERLIMTHAAERRLYGYPQANPVSRFVQEIPSEIMDTLGCDFPGGHFPHHHTKWITGLINRVSKEGCDENLLPQQLISPGTDGKYYKGAVVRHMKFGLGTVQRSEGLGDDLKIYVSFPGYGMKTLAVKYANLEVI
jgi:DNA helicase II / ATP-dependent DNA helicase PcrA